VATGSTEHARREQDQDVNNNPMMPSLPALEGEPAAPVQPIAAAHGWARASGPMAQLGRDTVLVLGSLPVAIVSFVVLVTGLSLAAGLLITVIGIPVAVATLYAASGFAWTERRRLAARGTPLQHGRLPLGDASRRPGLRGMLSLLSDRGRWAEVLHGIFVLPLAVFTWSVVLTWWVGSLGGLTYWFWSRWLPASPTGTGQSLGELLNLPMSESQFDFALGLIFAATLVPVVKGCANLHEFWARILLSGSTRRALQERVEDLTGRRNSAASAEAQALRRFERDLHDGPQQRLVRLGMDLSAAERRLDDDPVAARELFGQARAQAAEALAELRELSRGIAPPILSDRGLKAALASVIARSPIPTVLDIDLDSGPRPSAAIENAAYYFVCEALTNVAKHAAASSAVVSIRRTTDAQAVSVLRVEVKDDGTGGADLAKGHGLAGLANRIAGLDGTLTIQSPRGGPTRIVAHLPC
jgi:signal transduction histidine kinase